MFKIASKRGQPIDTPFSRWKKILSPTATSPKPSAIQITKGKNFMEYFLIIFVSCCFL